MGLKNNNPDQRKKFPNLLVLFIIGLVILFAMQNVSDHKRADVNFAYQLEHLVNLDFLDEKHSKKTALNENLVTFHGKFKEELSEDGKNRYQYLYLLSQYKDLSTAKLELVNSLSALKKTVETDVINFYELYGSSPYRSHIEILPQKIDSDGINSIIISHFKDPSKNSLVHLTQELSTLKNSQNPSNEAFISYGQNLSNLVRGFRSLGIADLALKDKLYRLYEKVGVLLEDSKNGRNVFVEGYESVIIGLNEIAGTLEREKNSISFYDLRSVKEYVEKLEQYEDISATFIKKNAQLEKARNRVAGVTWFFNNKQLSTKSLEKENNELYQQWFAQTKSEYEQFYVNKGLSFKTPDQKATLVLDKTFRSEEPAPNYLSYVFTIMPIVLIAMLLYFVFSRQMKGMGNSAMSFGKSPHKLAKDQKKVTFKDVAGIDEAREELEEVVDFLSAPQKFRELGARIPKGVLLVGPPGTGKTLIAKAVAGEANVPFFSISGSDFVEMFVGVGASRVRDLFTEAKKNTPCIIFIDEIDAVGRHRGAGMGGGHDEREQTLNQLLVELDGFGPQSGVIIIAATNRPDVLDKALLRPGRFDRQVGIHLPDPSGRFEILKVHARNVKLAQEVDLMAIAQMATACSGAQLTNIINEGALYAAKRHKKHVTQSDLEYAVEKVIFGKESRSRQINKEDLVTTAYHEAGHALIAVHHDVQDPIYKVTIIPRGQALGVTLFNVKNNRVSYKIEELLNQLVVLCGGRIAEHIINDGNVSNGAMQDIKQATSIARSMVCEWGMSDLIGMVNCSDSGDGSLISGYHERPFSDETARIIDQEVKAMITKAYDQGVEILTKERKKLDLMAEMLLKYETLDREDVYAIYEDRWSIEEKEKRIENEKLKAKIKPPEINKAIKTDVMKQNPRPKPA